MDEQKSVFVIEQGSYSDYRVVGVYTTQKFAEAVCQRINAGQTYEKAEVSEWPLNPAANEINRGLDLWRVLMLRSGAVEKVERQAEISGYDIEANSTLNIWRRSVARAYAGKNVPDVMNASVWAEDAEHAIKIANEKRGQMIAMGQWD